MSQSNNANKASADSLSEEQQQELCVQPQPLGPDPPSHHRGVSWGDVNVFLEQVDFGNNDQDDRETTKRPAASPSKKEASNNNGGGHQSASPAAATTVEHADNMDDKSSEARRAYQAAEAALQEQEQQRQQSQRTLLRSTGASKLKLEDLIQLHPMETEAETHILRALEQHDQRGTATEYGILSNIPDEALGFGEADVAIEPLPPMASTRSVRSSDLGNAGRQRKISIGSEMDDILPAATYTTPTVDSVWENDGEDAMAETVHRSHTHRRQKTMEQTLGTLTSALDELHRYNYPSTSSASPLSPTRPPTTIKTVSLPDGSADALAQNVSLLFGSGIGDSSKKDDTAALEMTPLVEVTEPAENGAPLSEAVSESSTTSSRKLYARKHWKQIKDAILQHGADAVVNDLQEETGDDEAVSAVPSSYRGRAPSRDSHGDVELGNEGGGGTFDSAEHRPVKRKKSWRLLRNIGLLKDMDEFLQPRRRSLWIFIQTILSIVLPALGFAFLFYYVFDNPDTSRFRGEKRAQAMQDNPSSASLSWWILFLGVRQVVTFALAHFLSLFLVDFICLERRWSLSCFGPTLTLLSKLACCENLLIEIEYLKNSMAHICLIVSRASQGLAVSTFLLEYTRCCSPLW